MNCTGCGQENATGARLCQTCGEATASGEVKAIQRRDVFGFVLGGPLLLPLIWQIWWFGKAIWTDHEPLGPYRGFLLVTTSLTAMVTLVAACLFIPTRHYDKAFLRGIGFVALAVSIAVAACCAVFSGYGAIGYLSDPAADFAAIGILYATAGTTACGLMLLAACVLTFKLRPRSAHAGIGVAIGSLVGLMGGGVPQGFHYALFRSDGHYETADVVSVLLSFLNPGLLIGAILGAALGAWIVRRAVGQRGSFRKALLGALLGSVVPLIGTVIGAVIGSGWETKPQEQQP